MDNTLPEAEMTVSDVLTRWPQTAAVFQQFKTACVGCGMAPFDTLADVADIYQFDLSPFLETLRQTATAKPVGV